MAKKSLHEEALEDVKLLKETAIENAKNTLVEAISPQIKEFVDGVVGEHEVALEMPMPDEEDPMMMGMDDTPEEGMYEEMPMGLEDLDPDALRALADKLEQSMGGEDHGDDHGHEDDHEDDHDMEREDEAASPFTMEASSVNEEEKMAEEVVEVTAEDLRQAFSEVVAGVRDSLTEAEVSKGFADAQNPNKNAPGGLGDRSAPGERGLEDKEKEEMWKDNKPPHSEDWTVAESQYKKAIAFLKSENTKLKSAAHKISENYNELVREMNEVNVFNSKLMHTNKLIGSTKLTNEQQLSIIESFDKAVTLREVELVYNSLSESLKIAGVLGEGKRPSRKGPKASRSLAPSVNQQALNESADHGGFNAQAKRWQELALLTD